MHVLKFPLFLALGYQPSAVGENLMSEVGAWQKAPANEILPTANNEGRTKIVRFSVCLSY